MLHRTLLTLVSLIAVVDVTLAQSGDSAKQQHALIGAAPANAAADIFADPARQWFPEAGLGLFIHWGISSVDGHHELSWGMMANCPWKAPKAPHARSLLETCRSVPSPAIQPGEMASSGQGRRLRLCRAHHKTPRWLRPVAQRLW